MREQITLYIFNVECSGCGYRGWFEKTLVPEIKEWDKCPQCKRAGGLKEVD